MMTMNLPHVNSDPASISSNFPDESTVFHALWTGIHFMKWWDNPHIDDSSQLMEKKQETLLMH